MAKTRFPGRGGTLSIDVTGAGTTYNQILLCRNITPPAGAKAWIDLMGMEDSNAQGAPGIEEASSEFSFETLWDPGDAQDASIRTAYENETKCNFQAVVTDGTTTLTVEWDGYIINMEPQGFGGNDPVIMSVTGSRVGAITESITP